MATITILNRGKNKTGKRFEVETEERIPTGLFSSKRVKTKMLLVLYKAVENDNELNSIVKEVLASRKDWKTSKAGNKYYILPNAKGKVSFADQYGNFPKRTKKKKTE
jgi:hypothetical protein